MANTVKINEHSKCGTCDLVPPQDQIVKCFLCNSVFHGYCEATNKDDNVGTKSMLKAFAAESTKGNFKFFCDPCLTNFEKDLVDTEKQKVACLEKKVESMESKLDKIMGLLEKPPQTPQQPSNLPQNVWNDRSRLGNVMKPPQTNKLVIKANSNVERSKETRESIEKVIMEKKIPIQTYNNNNGDMVVVCENENNLDILKESVASIDNDIMMSTPSPIRDSITIVGLQKDYTKDEILEMLDIQNGFIHTLCESSDIKQHIEIHSIRPLKNKANIFQAFVSVSTILRDAISYRGNKVTLGLQSCKVYDRYHVKRCNKCQQFGHYMDQCPSPDVTVCGKCSSHHHCTNDCDSNQIECINCVRNGQTSNTDHPTSSRHCPVLCHQQDIAKEKHLNLRSRVLQQW